MKTLAPALLVFLALLALTSPAPGAERPNVVFILADDLGYGDLGCYGQRRIKTPCLDRLAGDGVRFTQHYAGSTVCAPSRCVLMTGRHSGRAEVRGNVRHSPTSDYPLSNGAVTIAEKMKEAGYATALIGKWGLGDQHTSGFPIDQGFDSFFGYFNQGHAHNYYPEFLFRNGQKFPLPNVVPNAKPNGAGQASMKAQYSHDLFVEEAKNWLRANHQQPFFLYLALTIPHANNEAGREGQEVPDYGQYADKPWPQPQKGTAAMISRMDRDVGALRALLAELGVADDTLIVFTSDNGPHAEGGNDPEFFNSAGGLRGHKRDLYEGGIRVPTFAAWPAAIPAGAVSDHVSGFQDWMPTLCELAGAEPPSDIDGLSLAASLTGQGEQPEHEHLYWEFHEQGGKQAVRQGDWKGVRRNVNRPEPSPIELYNLAEDPAESRDLAAERPDVVRRIRATMTEAHRPSSVFPFRGEN